MYSTYNKGKSVVAERFIKTLRNKIFKHMAIVSKSVYFDFLDDIVKNYNNTFQRTMKMKYIDVKSTSYVEYNENPNEKGCKFKAGDHARISNIKTFLLKDILQIDQRKFQLLAKLKKKAVPWTYVINDLNGEEIFGTFL